MRPPSPRGLYTDVGLVSATLQQTNIENGLDQFEQADGATAPAQIGGSACRQAGPTACLLTNAPDLFARIWLADGETAEPDTWLTWWDYFPANHGRQGLAGIQAGNMSSTTNVRCEDGTLPV